MSNHYFFRLRHLAAAVGLPALGSLGGCAVYVPTVPSTPLVQKNQVELTAGLRGLTSLEATVAWAPTDHIFFNAEGAYLGYKATGTTNNVTTEYYDHHQQGNVGMGAYTLTKGPQPLYLAAVAGFGLADVDLHPAELFGPNTRYESSYRRYYGQAYLASQNPNFDWGLSVRATWVNYEGLLRDGVPLAVPNQWFVEPHFFVRAGHGPVQGYATLGLSFATRPDLALPSVSRGVFSPTSGLLGLGIVFRPQFLKQADQ